MQHHCVGEILSQRKFCRSYSNCSVIVGIADHKNSIVTYELMGRAAVRTQINCLAIIVVRDRATHNNVRYMIDLALLPIVESCGWFIVVDS